MAVGKREIKLVLSLDDSGFSVKAKNAKSTTDLLEASFGGLGKAAQNLESSVSSLSKDMGTFATGFTNLQKSLSSALNQLTSAVDRIGNAADKIGSASKGMSQLNASTTPLQKSLSSVSKEADNMGKVMDQARERLALARNGFVELDRAQKDSAAVAKSTSKDFADARVRALEAEIANDNRILQARGKLHADLKKLESDAAAQGMSARMQAETGRNANGRFINVNTARSQANQYETLATAHGLNALQTEESIKALRNERDARIDRLATLKKEIEVETQAAEAKKAAAALAKDAAKQAKIDAQESVANARRVAAAQQEAAQASLSAAREAARARMALARETAAAEREQAQQVAQMWKAMAQTYAGAKVGQGLKASVGVASDVEREKALVGTLALPKEEEDEIFASSKQMANQLKFISTLDAIKSRMSAISSLGHNNVEVIEQTLATAVKATNNLQYLGMSHGDTQSAIRNMYGVVEMRQQTADPAASNNTFETLQKIVTGTAGKVQVNDIETVLRRLGMGANSLSDNGLINLAAIIDQFKVAGGDGGAGGGVSTVGTAFKMMQAYAMGKGLSNTAVSQFADADILKTGGLDLSKDSAGVLRDAKHAGFKDADLWMRDPVAAVQKIMPKIVEYTQRKENRAQYYEGRDINDQQAQITAVTAYLARLGITTTASQALMVAGDPRSQKRIAEQNHTISNSKGIDEVAQSIEGTAGQKWSVAKAQLTDLGAAIGESIMPEVKALLDGLNSVLSVAVKFASENKMTTQVLAISAAFAGATLAFKGFTGMFGAASSGLTALSSLLNVAKAGTESMATGVAKASAAQVEATAANARHLTAVANSADATRSYTAAKLAEAQAHVQSVSGFKQLTAVQTVLVPAQQAHRVATETATAAQKAAAVAAAEHTAAQTALSAVASAASPIMRALSGALALVGGPIGAITLALTLGALAWDKFGSEASKAADKARKASEDSASAVEGALKRIKEAKLAEEGVLGKDGKKVTGANASVIDTERQELARLRGELIKSKAADQENATYAAEAAKYSDSGMVMMPKSNTADLQKQIAQREKNLSDLLQAEDEQNKRFAAKQAQQEKEAKEKIAVAGADKSNAAANKAVVDSAQPKDRKPRERIDPLNKALGEAEGKVNSQKIKLQALVNGTKELSTLREEAEAEVEGKRKAGDYNKDKDPNKPVAANDPRIAQLVEQVYQEKLLNEQVKAVQFANERNAASTLEADEAMKRIAGEGAAQQTDAFRALSRELVRAEERLGAGAASLQAWKSAKDEALAGQAKADLLNFSADMAEKSKTTNARYGYDTERERLVAERKAVEEAEEAKYKVRLDTLNRTRAARIADAQATETDLVSREARIAQINKETDDTISAADAQMNKERQARALETARILERPIDALAREWRDKYKQLDDMTASWANGFMDTLTTALTTGKLNWRGFLSGMATDLLKTQLKDSFGKQITDMFSSLGSTVKGWFGAAPAASGAATAAGTAATSGATAAATAGAAGAAGAAASTAASEAAAASMQAVANSSGQAAASMVSLTAQGIEPAIASTVQQVAQDVTATATTELTSVSLGLLGDSAMFAAEAMMQAAAAAAGQSATSMFADGGIMSSGGSLPLKKYANGGIANRPQLAIFGEGSMNEAYVPLPDGRSIPVTLNTSGEGGTSEGGGGGGTVVTIQINVSGETSNSSASGDDKGVWTTMAARVKGIVQQELEVQKRPGGQLYSA